MTRPSRYSVIWWAAYSKSIRDRRGSHPTTEAEAKAAKAAADEAVRLAKEVDDA